ncbi:MAG: type II toxin-antitoxin system VapC family toxin [Candidatus Njordarchaeia archaeon]
MIIDASVVAKWFLKGEEWEKESLKLKEMFEKNEVKLYAPTLILYEVGNIIWKRKEIPKDIASKLVNKAFEYLKEIVLIPTSKIAEMSMKIARKHGITFYDATYVALSDRRKEYLVTADKKLYEKIKNEHLTIFISNI